MNDTVIKAFISSKTAQTKRAHGLLSFKTVYNEVHVFLEYYLIFKHTSWLKNVRSSLVIVSVYSRQFQNLQH